MQWVASSKTSPGCQFKVNETGAGSIELDERHWVERIISRLRGAVDDYWIGDGRERRVEPDALGAAADVELDDVRAADVGGAVGIEHCLTERASAGIIDIEHGEGREQLASL